MGRPLDYSRITLNEIYSWSKSVWSFLGGGDYRVPSHVPAIAGAVTHNDKDPATHLYSLEVATVTARMRRILVRGSGVIVLP